MTLALLIPLSIGLGLIGVGAFFWALGNGQFDDPDGAAWRVIQTAQSNPKGETSHDQLASDTPDRHA